MRWFSQSCKELGIPHPPFVSWPLTGRPRLLDGRTWKEIRIPRPVHGQEAIPTKFGLFLVESDWLQKVPNDKLRKPGAIRYAFPCWAGSDLVAVVLIDVSRKSMESLGDITLLASEFTEALNLLQEFEMMQARILALQECLKVADQAIVITAINGRVLGATANAERILGQTIHGDSFWAIADQAPDKVPECVTANFGIGRMQMRMDDKTTFVIKQLKARTISTVAPIYRIEILAEVPSAPQSLPLSKLSFCENQVFALLTEGKTNLEIATVRKCSLSTIRHQVEAIYAKLRIHRREELIARFHRLAIRPSERL